MEPEDLPWPGELEEEEEEGEKEEEEEEKAVGDIVAVDEDYVVEEDHAEAEDGAVVEDEAVVADIAAEVEPAEVEQAEVEPAEVAEQEDSVKSDETVLVEEVEEEARPELNVDFDFEFQSRESIDDEEEDEEAKAWLQAPPEASFSLPPPPRHSYLTGERTSREKIVPLTCNIWQQPLYQGNVRTQSSDTSFVSLETTSQWSSEDDQRMESWHGLLQEKKSSPQSLDTSQTRINLKAERSKVTESSFLEEGVLTQSEGQVKKLSSPLLVIQDDFATPDLPLLTCLTQDQEFGPDSLFHQSELDFAPLRGIPDKSEDIEWFSRPSEVSEALLQATSEASSDLVNSCFSVSQYPLLSSTNIGSQHSCLSPEQKSEEYVVNDLKTPKEVDSYNVLCSCMSWNLGKDTKQSENNLADKDQVSVSTLSAISDDNIATKSNDSFDASSEHVQCWKEEALQQAETCLNSTDNICFPQEVATPPHSKRSYSFLRCLLERRGKKEAPLDPENHYFENVDLRVPAENEVKQKMDFLEGYEGNEDLQKELSRYFEQNESRSNLASSEVHPTSPEMNYAENVVVVDNSVRFSEAHILSRGHDISKTEASSGSLQTVEVQLDETSEPLYFEEERNQKATSIFEDLHGKAKSDVITLDGDSKCRSLDEHAVVCCEKVELQGKTCDQYNLATSEYVELATLENLLDDLCESSLNWQPTLQSSSKENKLVSHSNLCINQSFSSTLPSFAPYEPTRDSEHHSSNLRMLRVSPDTVTKIVAWKLKLNLAHDYGYPISELNEDDRRKVEEIKAKLFCEGRTADFSESPRGIGCPPESVCSHIIIESHEKGCFRTVSTQPPQVNSHPCVSRSVEPSEVIRGRRSPAPWRNRHINFSKSLDQNNPHLKVWNSLQLQSHPPFQNLMHDDFKISKSFGVPFRENIDPWLSEIEPAFVPPKEVDFHSSPQILPSEPMKQKQFTTSITFSSHRHSKCISDSSVFKVGVTQGSQYTGAPVGVFNSHVIEEQISPRDLKQKASSPSSIKKLSYLPDREMTILAEGSRQSQTLPVDSEHSHQEEKLLERSGFKVSHSEPRNGTNSKEVQLSDNNTLISMDRPTPDLPSHIFLEQRELFEQSKSPHTDHSVRKHHSPPCLNLPPCIFLEQKELYEQSKVPHVDHEMRKSHTPLPQCQDSVASDLHSPICFEQHQSKAPGVDAHHFLFSQGQDCVVEKTQHRPNSPISNLINVEAKFNNVISQSAPDYCQLETSASTPPSNRKALSCIRITLSPKTPSKLDSGTLDKRFHLLDPASKTRMNSEFNRDLQYKSSESLEATSKLLTSKPLAQDQEYVGFLGPKTPPDLQAVQSPFPDSKTIIQDLKNLPSQNSQIVTSRQTQVNISDLEGYSKPEETPVSADGSREQSKPHFSASSGKLSSDAVTQITTESPEKTMFSSEIFINAGDCEEPSTSKPHTVPVKFASSSSVQQISPSHGVDAQPVLLPYKPAGSQKMYYVPQLEAIPSFPDCKSSDTTLESSHSGSNDAIAPDFPAQVLGTRDDNPPDTVNIKHEEGIYSKRAVTKASFLVGKKPFQKGDAEAPIQVPEILSGKHKEEIFSQRVVTKIAWPEGSECLQKDTEDSSETNTAEDSAQIQDKKIENLPETKAFEQKEEIHIKRTVCKETRPKEKESLQIDISESKCHSEFENTTHSVFRSAKFYFHHPVHLPNDQDFCHESLGKSTLMRHSWKDFFQHHSNKLREPTCLPLSYQSVDKTKMDYSRGKSLSINMNLGDNEEAHASKSQARDNLKNKRQINDPKKDHKVTTELTTQPTTSLNELWNKYQERQKQQKPLDVSDKKELSLIERLDRLAKLLQNPITHSLQVSESTLDDSRGERDFKEWNNKQQKKKLQKQKRYRSLEKGHKNIGDLKKSKVASHQTGKSNQIKIEQIKFDKYILKKQPYLNYISNTSSDSRPSEESELLTDTTTNILSTTTSPRDSDILTQTDREVTLHERSSSISTIDTARLIQAFGHERVCLSPRQIKLYSSITNQQRRYLEKRCKHTKKALNISHPQMTSEHTRRKHIQMANHRISSDSVASASSCLSLESTLCTEQIVPMFNKGIQAGNLEILDGVKKHTRDVGVTFPTPCSSEARLEEESDETSVSEEIIKEKTLFASPLEDKKLKSKQNSYEGVSWFVPVENVKPATKKENCPKSYGPGISWFEPMSRTKPWREPLREQNWQKQCMVGWGLQPGPGGDVGQEQLTPFVRTTLQESLQLHRPDFISRSGERVKRLKLIVQERKLQNVFQSERNALFNAMHPLPKRVLRIVQKNKPIGRKEMIQRSKRIYEQLPEVQKKREEEKRKSEYKSNRLRAQLFRKKLTSQLLGRKVPWD
ncbi:PREDICTED: Alstrom syndrome protein 1 [Dipodomys ordii]|uniref:Alstrom syndrome protein 1 n=1 Tax=Dipodomys ordii TaxID=10020 RepID=A0A1S3GR00_DIPOR|nr:PREDICTED: Alstrom syndrome protein 1 [Dipodomys ordii]